MTLAAGEPIVLGPTLSILLGTFDCASVVHNVTLR